MQRQSKFHPKGRFYSRILMAGLIGVCAGGIAVAQDASADRPKALPAPEQSAEHDISPALYELRMAWGDKSIMPLTLRHMDDIFLTRNVPHSGTPWNIPRSNKPLKITYEYDGKTYTADQWLDRTYTNALLVIKDGHIVHETYRNGSDETDRFAGFSMTKSITSIMIGCAVDRGWLNISDRIDKYLPELKGGAYEGVSIKHVLQMRSGAYRVEDYSNLRDILQIKVGSPTASMRDNIARYTDAAKTVERKWEPGSHYHYLNLDTAVLGWLIERVSQRSIASFATECVWEPIGAEADAYFIMDGEPGVGREFNAAGFNATLRDWGRVGLMMLQRGAAKSRVIPDSWVAESTAPVPNGSDDGWGYAYQWWTVDNSSAYAARGRFGQQIFIDPDTNTVIVKMSYVPLQADQARVRTEALTFFQAVSNWKAE